MTLLALIALCQLALVAWVLWRRDRAQDRLLEVVERLCQRVQAPQLAAIEHHGATLEPAPTPVSPEDDNGHWQTLSKEQLAELAMSMELRGDR